MMKTVSAALIAFTLGAGAALAADPVEGLWKTETGETGGFLHVKIAQCGANICGTIEKVINNDNQSIVGRQMIWDMEARGGGDYRGGKIWAPDADKTYRSKMSLNGDALTVQGCVGPICRGQTWTRLN